MSALRRLFQSARERNSLTWREMYWQGGLYASQSGKLTVVKAKRFIFFRNLFIDLIAFAVQYVPIGTGAVGSVSSQPVRVQLLNNGRVRRVRVVHLWHFSGLHGFGSHFQIKYGSGSVPRSTFTGLFGFGYEFLDPWRPLMVTHTRNLCSASNPSK